MIKNIRVVFVLSFVLGLVFSTNVFAQGVEYSSSQGEDWFNSGNYIDAEKAYAYLVEKYPKDQRYNYYLGICQLTTRSNVSESLKRLNLAKIKNVNKDVYFYLGRAHQLLYHFEEAISSFEKYISLVSKNDEKSEQARTYISECKDARKISLKIYGLTVLDKVKIHESQLLKYYTPAKDVGHLYKNGEFFEAGVNPNHIMFETERGDVVYFPMEANSTDTLNIFKMEKLIDGWGDSKSLGSPVNSPYNDAYPFLATDGLTFYFASDRPGGFGGFDIYKVFYDSDSQSFMDPVNMGVPFNSPDDDFLFVSDDFNKVAWFASNRETYGDSLMVYTIKWDGTQVRSMVENVNDITVAAQLSVTSKGDGLATKAQNTANTNYRKRNVKEELFNFVINDTIHYTSFENFKNPEAQKLFKAGFVLQQQKDSLAMDMKLKRIDYARESNETRRNEIVNEILRLENQVYSLEDQIEEKYMYARQKELYEIHDQVKRGVYKPQDETVNKEENSVVLDGILIPEKYSMYTTEEFERISKKYDKLYRKLFSVNDIGALKYADSLYVWANILNIESAQLLASSRLVEEENNVKISDLIKKVKGEEEEPQESNAEKMIKESKELKILSTRIYHKALDKKYPIYWLKLKDISSKMSEDSEVNDLIYQGNAYFREAKNLLNELGGMSLENFEKAGTLKRAGIESQENALKVYSEMLDENNVFAGNQSKSKVQKSYSELQKGEEAYRIPEEKKSEKVEEKKDAKQTGNVSAIQKEGSVNEEYRVQIGVFRNAPNPDVLAQLPNVTSMELEGKGLTKYFSGSFTSKEEALKIIPQVIDAGFPGAFVVYFKEGKLTTMPKN